MILPFISLNKGIIMEKDTKMQLALTLADAAEGLLASIESFKLIASSLDDTANLLREGAGDDQGV